MSQAFVPPAEITAEDMNTKSIAALSKTLDGKILAYKCISDEIYANAITVAENIDEREETNVPMRRNAVYVASLLAKACIRGAQIS
jgi:hypothetical protein